MSQSKGDIELGRFLSLVLRHKPEAAGVELDANGWVEVDALLAGVSRTGRSINRARLERIVAENSKRRYSFSPDGTKVRANQGHSVSVDVELERRSPPALLYHGTATRFLESIRREGICRGTRQHVHLSADMATAEQVGRRHGSPVILPVDAAAMERDGAAFYRSANGVWLCEGVPWRYVREDAVVRP